MILSPRALSLLFLGLAPLACGAEESSSLETGDIEAKLEVRVEDGPEAETKIDAYLTNAKGFGDVELVDGDELHVVTDKGDDLRLAPDSVVGKGFYGAVMAGVTDRSQFRFELRRQGKRSALDTRVTVAPPLALTSAIEGKTYRADDTVELAWSNPAGAGVTFYVLPDARPCGGAQIGGDADALQFADGGTASFRAGALLKGAPDPAGTCVTLRLQRAGGTDRNLDGKLHPDSELNVWRSAYVDIKIVP